MNEQYDDDARAVLIRLDRGGAFVGFGDGFRAGLGDRIAVQLVEEDDETMARVMLTPAEAERVARWLLRAAVRP